MPILYVGMNTFTSFKIFSDLGKNKGSRFAFFTSAISAFFLAMMILVISDAISPDYLRFSLLPILTLLRFDKFGYTVMLFVCLIGIFSTLICSLYASFSIIKENFAILKRCVLSVAVFFISKFGFSKIVNDFYPILGVLGVIFVIIVSLRAFFPKRRPTRTYRPLKRII